MSDLLYPQPGEDRGDEWDEEDDLLDEDEDEDDEDEDEE